LQLQKIPLGFPRRYVGGEKKLKKSPYIPPFFKGGEIKRGFKSKAKALPYK